MSSHDSDLADQLTAIAPAVGQRLDETSGDTVTAAADRLRAIAALPPDALPPPPIVPIKLEAMPDGVFEHTLERVDTLASGFHQVGRMPRRNAKLDKPKAAAPREYRIFTDPRMLKDK